MTEINQTRFFYLFEFRDAALHGVYMYGENTIAAIRSVIGALWPPLWVPPKLACRDCRDCHQPTSTAHFLAPVVDARPGVAPHADVDVHLVLLRAHDAAHNEYESMRRSTMLPRYV